MTLVQEPKISTWCFTDNPGTGQIDGIYRTYLHAIDALQNGAGSLICKIEVPGDVTFSAGQVLSTKINLLWAYDATEMLRMFARELAFNLIHFWDAPKVVREYLEWGGVHEQGAAYFSAKKAWEEAGASSDYSPEKENVARAIFSAMTAAQATLNANTVGELVRAAANATRAPGTPPDPYFLTQNIYLESLLTAGAQDHKIDEDTKWSPDWSGEVIKMKTLDEVRGALDSPVRKENDPFGWEDELLARHLPDSSGTSVPLTEGGIYEDVVYYLPFALSKAINHRGISCLRSVTKLKTWAWLLGLQDLVDFAGDENNYNMYGVPVLRQFAIAFSVELPNEFKTWENGKACRKGCNQGCNS